MRKMFAFIGVLCLLQSAILVHAQLITLRDGKVGVNFAGYHADAGLGGLLTGNSAHGGLSASAGTPWGSRAAAGLGGNLDGRTDGFGYAAAQANPSVGASALLGGSAGEHGYIGAEAHSPGKTVISSKQHTVHQAPVAVSPTSGPDAPPALPTVSNNVQRVKPPKKYSLIRQDSPVKTDVKTVQTHKYSKTVQRPQTVENRFLAPQSSPVGLALDIPIGILRSLQQSLGNLVGGGAQPNAGVAPVQG
ncbi:uncharacterized protein LOC6593135 isoform X1 [Drosophila persimilis]|uniref:Uncharacterized protein isoform X2 n=1 Tax=Drosophila pseudoobscura pseudoobscura TaxID=46245 RepID=A0A6I8V6F2_DROPS|nr:uncharacterized protein LOC4804484 isoform X2 [Drosophila pseudoobscura]XP_026842090.1 uncharacterized protein LOC6593135 isoform X1 [Drosophila persimilis]